MSEEEVQFQGNKVKIRGETEEIKEVLQDWERTINDEPLQKSLGTLLIKALRKISGKPTESWKKNGFNVDEELMKRKGPFIEVAGPTFGGYEIVDMNNLHRDVFVSNITPGVSICHHKTGKELGYIGDPVDFQADARKLPFANNSLGAIFISGSMKIPSGLSNDFMDEAKRTLEEGGLLIWQHLDEKFYDQLTKMGLTILEKRIKFAGGDDYHSAIFQKPSSKP